MSEPQNQQQLDTGTHSNLKQLSLFINSSVSNSFFLFVLQTQIGILPRGVNPPSANMLTFSGSYVALTIKTGIMTGILSLTVRTSFVFLINLVNFNEFAVL